MPWLGAQTLNTEGPPGLYGPVRDWLEATFPGGPTGAQVAAWPAISAGENTLLISPTGTGKTLAAFLAILDRLLREHAEGQLAPGLRCVYVSPLRSLGYDIERNLTMPLDGIRTCMGLDATPVRVAVRTGDTNSHARRKLREEPPHILITTPESLSLLLSQQSWAGSWRGVEHVIVDEIHSLVPSKRGADLAVTLERLAASAERDPCRVGLSATCRPAERVAHFLVGTGRSCRVLEVGTGPERARDEIRVESLLLAGEASHRALTYRRLLKRLCEEIEANRTTIIFANTRAFTEKLTSDLRRVAASEPESIAAHHSSLDAVRRREVEGQLKSGALRAVVTSTSLELGVDIGSVDLAALVGLPGSVSRCLQRIGRAGHQPGTLTRGLLLAGTPAELVGLAVTARAARERRIEPVRMIDGPLDVLSQQLVAMACAGEWGADEAFALVRRAAPFERLHRADFDACLDFLSGQLAAPAGAFEPEPGAAPRWTAPRLWRHRGRFGVRNSRVVRWFRQNVGTIQSEETVRVAVNGSIVGTLEGHYAERLQPGDRFVLDGRILRSGRLEALTLHATADAGEADLPRWSSDRQGLTRELAEEVARFREDVARWAIEGGSVLRAWLIESYGLDPDAAEMIQELFEAQEIVSEVPRAGAVLVEESPHQDGYIYAFHVPLSRSACEAAGRAIAARLGKRLGRDVALSVADLGWSIILPEGERIEGELLPTLLHRDGFLDDLLLGLNRGDLLARRFRHVAATGLMVLKNPEGGRKRVGGLLWVSQRLYPLVLAACPDHPLLRETRREVLNDLLDASSALDWLETRPEIRFRRLDGPSPFTAAWLGASEPEPLRFEAPAEALKRLHARVMATAEGRRR